MDVERCIGCPLVLHTLFTPPLSCPPVPHGSSSLTNANCKYRRATTGATSYDDAGKGDDKGDQGDDNESGVHGHDGEHPEVSIVKYCPRPIPTLLLPRGPLSPSVCLSRQYDGATGAVRPH